MSANGLELRHLQPVAEGMNRLVFEHPLDDTLLVKVVKPTMRARLSVWPLPLLRVRRPFGIYRDFAKSISEYVSVRACTAEHPRFLERIHGLVETDFGLGMVVEKVTDWDGSLAPTLLSIVTSHGLDDRLAEEIIGLRDDLIGHDIVVGGITFLNIVQAFDRASGGGYLVVIDGLGDKTLIPVNSISRYMNRRTLVRNFDRLIGWLKEIDRDRTLGHRLLRRDARPSGAGSVADPEGLSEAAP